MITIIYDFWCKFIRQWTAIVPISHSIDEETGDIFCGHSPSTCLSTIPSDNNNNKRMPPTLQWQRYKHINEMPEAIFHQKDAYKNSSSNITNASNDAGNKNLDAAKPADCKSSDEKTENSLN
uniref:Uncharacterized protein n=1 Tax=Panagrolaimus sp. PS1159 TaxID=55785 RepID=A0AC35GML9_9BILA